MKLGVVLNTSDPENVWNALRFGVTSLNGGHNVKVFLLGRGVEIEEINDERFNVAEQISRFLQKGGELVACGTCLKIRNKKGMKICLTSSMQDLLKLVEDSDRFLVFS